MDNDEYTNMRKKLKISDLDENKRTEMFKTFTNAGGKVIDLNKKDKEPIVINKDKKGKKGKKDDFDYFDPMQRRREEAKKQRLMQKGGASGSITSSKYDVDNNPVSRWIERFSAKLSCVFGGIFTFSGQKFKTRFINLMLNDYQTALLESRMVLASVLHQNQMVQQEIRKKINLDTKNPYIYEIMQRFENLYSEEAFNRLESLRDDPFRVEELKSFLIEIFKPIYLLKNYVGALKSGVEKALLYEKELRKLNASITFANYRKVTAAADVVFQRVYTNLFSLVDYYHKMDSKFKMIPFKKYIKIEDSDLIGYLSNKWKEERELEATKDNIRDSLKSDGTQTIASVEQENKEKTLSDDIFQDALDFLKKYVKFKVVLQKHREEKKDLRALFSINDKMFLMYTILDFFDKEYSFLFTSTKVKYNMTFNAGVRIDIKKDLTNLYYKISSVFDRVNEYLKIIKEIVKLNNDGYITMKEKASLSNQYSVERSRISRAARKEARELFEKIAKNLFFVIDDYNNHKNILQNHDEKLEFNKKIDGERLVDGKTVIEAVHEAYGLSYLIHSLLIDGDIGGYSVVLEKPIYLDIND